MRKIELGMDIERFLTGSIGLYVMTRGENERANALDELAKVDAEDPKKIRHLQNQVTAIDLLNTWLMDALSEAEEAERQLHEAAD